MHFGRKILTIDISVDDLIPNLMNALEELGMKVARSFDLQSACAPHNSPCPHHRTIPCNCQLVVLVLHDRDGTLGTLTIHGSDGQSEISMIQGSDVWNEAVEESIVEVIKTTARSAVK